MKKINIPAAFGKIPETWSPHIAGAVNSQEVRIARIDGAFDWHAHQDGDEAFFVIRGAFSMGLRCDGREWEEAMEEGDFLVVPAGVSHRPVAEKECWILMIENAGTLNTGDTLTERTRETLPRL